MDDFDHAIALGQILIRIVYSFDGPEEGLSNGVVILDRGVELKQVANRRLALRQIRTGGDVDRVKDIVIEIIFIWADTWLFKRVYGERCSQVFDVTDLGDESVDLGDVCGWIARDERCIHVTGCHGY